MPSEQIGSAYAEVGFKVDESGLNSAKSKFSAALGDMESKAKSTASAIGGALKTGLEVAAVAGAGIATAGLAAYKDLETAASSAASKAVDVSGKSAEEIKAQYDTIQKHIMDVSQELGSSTIFNPTQVAQTYDVLAAKGVNVANVGKSELLPFLDLAAATQSDLASVTDLVTGSINSFGLSMSDSGTVADQLAMAMNGSSASMETLNYALRQGGSTASATGMQLSEFSAIVGVLADKNYTGEQSGAALKTAMLALYNPTKVQSEALDKLGISYDQIDPRTHNFMDTLELLISKGADIGDFGKIFTDSSGAIMYALAGDSDAVDALNQKIIGSDGLAHTQAQLMIDSEKLTGAYELAKSATEGLSTAIGGALEPAAVALLNAWTALVPAIQDFAVALASGNWSEAGDLLVTDIQEGWTKLEDLGTQLLNWILKVDYGAIGDYLYKGARAGWDELMSIGSELLDALVSVDWGSVGSALLDALTSAIQSVIETASGIYSYFTGIDWGSVAGYLKDAFFSAVDALSDIGSTILDYLTSVDWAGAGTQLKDAFTSAVTSLANIGQQIWDYIGSIDWGSAGYKVADAIRTAITTLSDIGSTIWNYLTSADWSGAGSSIAEKIRSGLETLSKYWEEFKAGFLTVDWAGTASEVATKIKDAWKKISDWASGIIDGIKKDWQAWIDNNGPKTLGEDLAKAIAKGATDLGKWIYDNIEGYFTSNGATLRSSISGAIDFAKLAVQTAYDFVTGFANTVLTAGKGTIGAAILEIIGGAMNSAWEGAGDGLIEKAESWRKDAENIFSSDDFDVDVSTKYTGAGNPKDLDGSTISVNVDYKSTTGAALTPYSTSGKTTVTLSEGEYYLKTKDFTQMKVTDWAKQMGQSKASYAEVLAMVNQMRTGKGDVTLSQKVIDQIMGAFVEGQTEYDESQTSAAKAKAEIEKKGAEEEEAIEKKGAEDEAVIGVQGAKDAAAIATNAGKSISDALNSSTEKYLIGSQTAADAIKLGGGAVKIGLVDGAKEIAVIGSVEQKRWTDMGETLYSKVIVSSDGWVGAVEKTTILISDSWAAAANAAVEKSQTASSNYKTAFEAAGVSWKENAQSTSKATMAELSSGISKLTFKVSESSDDFKGGIDASKTTWQYGVSGSVSTWQSGIGNSGATLTSGASSAGSSMASGGSSAGSDMRSGGRAAASSLASAVGSWSRQSWNYYGYAEGTVTRGPQMAVIGEDGAANPEYVIPTKKKRWDLLYAAMRSYGLKGFAEGTATGTGGGSGDAAAAADPDAMAAYFSIQGLASMSKQVQRILNNLKDFFALTWAIIKSEGTTYWKQIETVLVTYITSIRDEMWAGLLDIRNTAISSDASILSSAKTTWAAYWPAVEPYISKVSENLVSEMKDAKSALSTQIESMISDTESQMSAFEKKWQEIWTQLITDLTAAKSKITALVSEIAALLKKISVTINANLNVYESSGSGGSGGGSGWLDEFTIGCGIKLNSRTSSSGGTTKYSYTLPKIFGGTTSTYYAAKGALLDDGQQTIIAGEAGPELILPANLTRMFLSLADAGLGQGAKSQASGNIVIEDHTVHEHYWNGKRVVDLVLTDAVKKLQLKGMKSVS